jgi:flagellar hook-associated protein 2
LEGIKNFVDKYNEIVRFAAEQSKDPKAGEPGKLSGDGTVKSVMRQLQTALFPSGAQNTKYQTLAEVGITTNPKTGELSMDDTKVRNALTEDYDGVANLFIRSKFGDGIGERITDRIKSFRNSESGMVRSRIRGLERVVENSDKEIARRERLLDDKEESIKRRFTALEGQMAGLKAQGDFLSARFGAGGSPQGGGG